jgi:two-component system, chemotaxis family, chemotaxis protein CheY
MNTVLVVDDSFVARMMSRKVLESGGYTVLEADDGDSAIIALQRHSPGLVLLDLLMPGENGVEVMQRLKKVNKLVPVLVLSADIQESTRNRCIEQGAAGFMGKPPRPETLLPMVEALLNQSSGNSI